MRQYEWHGTPNRHPTYVCWAQMKTRCQNKNNAGYPSYGGRGIKVCQQWQWFSNFLADMGHKPAGKSLGRIDNDGNYEPSNCRWETPLQQQGNTRFNRKITFAGRTMCLSAWAREVGICHNSMRERLEKWSLAKALGLKAIPLKERIAMAHRARWNKEPA